MDLAEPSIPKCEQLSGEKGLGGCLLGTAKYFLLPSFGKGALGTGWVEKSG
jgi:hypothetical protein